MPRQPTRMKAAGIPSGVAIQQLPSPRHRARATRVVIMIFGILAAGRHRAWNWRDQAGIDLVHLRSPLWPWDVSESAMPQPRAQRWPA